jgi:hypothetical protein
MPVNIQALTSTSNLWDTTGLRPHSLYVNKI